MSSFADGSIHPLLAPAHVVALIALAVLTGRDGGAARGLTIAIFAAGLAGGLGAVAWGAGETPAADGLLAAAALCGLIAASGRTTPRWMAASLGLTAGVAIGLDSPPQSIRLNEAVLMLIGTGCGAVAALALMTVAASFVARFWQGVALRVAGSWIAAIAILVLALRWAG